LLNLVHANHSLSHLHETSTVHDYGILAVTHIQHKLHINYSWNAGSGICVYYDQQLKFWFWFGVAK